MGLVGDCDLHSEKVIERDPYLRDRQKHPCTRNLRKYPGRDAAKKWPEQKKYRMGCHPVSPN